MNPVHELPKLAHVEPWPGMAPFAQCGSYSAISAVLILADVPWVHSC